MGEGDVGKNFCGLISLSMESILLRGEHFPLENFIHSVNIGVLITKTPRISATSFSPPGGKKVSLHTYWGPMTLALTGDMERVRFSSSCVLIRITATTDGVPVI